MPAPSRTSSLIPDATPPRRGRRPKGADGQPALTRQQIIDQARRIAQDESLDAVSMVRLGRELGVAPGLIHYHVGSREQLLSAVINTAFRERFEALPPASDDWHADLDAIARVSIAVAERWPGLSTYVLTHNRFRLFQDVESGETDYGLAYFDHIGRVFQRGGFTAEQAALAYHLLMLFVSSVSAERENRQSPGMHRDYIVGHVGRFDPAQVVGARFLVEPFARLDSAATLDAGLALLLDGFAAWLTPPARPGRSRRAAG